MSAFLAVFLLLIAATAHGIAMPGQSFEDLSRQAAGARDHHRAEEAMRLYTAALKLKPTWDEGWWSLGSIEYDQDLYRECAGSFHSLAMLQPDSAPAWTMEGLCEYSLRDLEAARRSFSKTESLAFHEPKELSVTARLHLALVLTKTGSFEKAIAILSDLTKFDRKTQAIVVAAGIAGLRRPWLPPEVPEDARGPVMKLGEAMASAMEMDVKGSLEEFESAVAAYPGNVAIHYRFGAYLLQEDPERGIAELKKALDLDPAYVPALMGLAMTYLNRGDAAAAKSYAERSAKADPNDFGTHVVLGRALLGLDDAAGAAVELERAVRIDPANPEARFSLATAYARLGRKADAAREHEEFKRLKKLVDSSQPQP